MYFVLLCEIIVTGSTMSSLRPTPHLLIQKLSYFIVIAKMSCSSRINILMNSEYVYCNSAILHYFIKLQY